VIKVTGTLLLDGKPVEGATVAFQPVADAKAKYHRPSSAVTDSSGKFSPGTYGTDDGLPVGKYKVGVQKREVVGNPGNVTSDNPETVNLKYQWLTPRKYADPSSSGLEVEVTSSAMKPDVIELKSDGAKPEIELTGPQRKANEP
jgi:hypothetical protein